jgi:hypothetical protein
MIPLGVTLVALILAPASAALRSVMVVPPTATAAAPAQPRIEVWADVSKSTAPPTSARRTWDA